VESALTVGIKLYNIPRLVPGIVNGLPQILDMRGTLWTYYYKQTKRKCNVTLRTVRVSVPWALLSCSYIWYTEASTFVIVHNSAHVIGFCCYGFCMMLYFFEELITCLSWFCFCDIQWYLVYRV